MDRSVLLRNPAVAVAVSAWLCGERFPHAVLLEGGTAAQRLSAAQCLAAALVCDNKTENQVSLFAQESLFGQDAEAKQAEKPCGVCTNCVKAQAGMHPDIRTVSGGEAAKSFHTQTVREMRADAYILPNEAAHKVYILEQVQNMTLSAQNALLTILEEPPQSVCFLLLCENKNRMLSTILSRVSVLDLHENTQDAAQGSEKAQEDVGEKEQQTAAALAKALAGRQEFALLQASAVFAKDKPLFRAVLPLLQTYLRDALLLQSGLTAAQGQAQTALLAQTLSRRQALACFTHIQGLMEALDQNENYTLLTARFCSLLWGEKEKE